MGNSYDVLLMPNAIARGSYSIGEKENNLFYRIMYCVQRDNREYIIAKRKNEALSDSELKKWAKLCEIETLQCKLTKNDIENILKNNNDRTDEGIDNIFLALAECYITFKTVTRDKIPATLTAPLIAHHYKQENGDYLIVVAAKLYKYLFDLGLGHTQNALQILYSLNGTYSKRLYLIFRSWSGTKREIKISVQDLREMLQVTNKNMTFNSFETNILKRAIKEINNLGVMNISIKEKIKKGRSVSEVIFKVIDKEPRKYTEYFSEPEIEPVVWLDYILVENEELLDRLKRKHFDVDFNSPIVRNIYHRAFDKTLNRDNRFKMIQDKKSGTNYALFNSIVASELLTHELALEQQFNTSII